MLGEMTAWRFWRKLWGQAAGIGILVLLLTSWGTLGELLNLSVL